MKSALAGRDDSSLSVILTFLARNINDPSHSNIVIQVANTLLGKFVFYSCGVYPFLNRCYLLICRSIREQLFDTPIRETVPSTTGAR